MADAGAAPTTTKAPIGESGAVANIPAAAKEPTSEGAKAFAAYYMRQVNQSRAKGMPQALAGLALDSCGTCKNFVQAAVELQERKQHQTGTLLVPGDIIRSRIKGTYAAQQQRFTTDGFTTVDESGRIVERGPASKVLMTFGMRHDGSRWRISEIAIEAEK